MNWTHLPLALALAACPALAQERAPVAAADVEAVARGDAAFACELYHALREQPGNLFLSPYSVSQALGLAYAGAKGETAAELERVLHVELPAERWHLARRHVAQTLATPPRPIRGRKGQPFRLTVAERAWGQRGYSFRPAYLEQLRTWYGAELEQVDFVGDTEAARQTINAWISEQTEERIPELLQRRDVKPDTRLVLTNAIYFHAAWQSQFEPEATREAEFQRLDESTTRVPFMSQVGGFNTGQGEGYQWVELPYEGRTTSMLVVIPDAGTFAAFEAGLDTERLTQLLAAKGGWKQLELRLPRFEARSRLELKEALQAVGLEHSFLPNEADFSGVDGGRDLFVGQVIHEAFVKVDESGTEAAAATAVIMDVGAAPAEPTLLAVDRPFLYLIRERKTGTVIFWGRVLDPSVTLE